VDAGVVVALIALAGAIAAAGVSLYGQLHAQEVAARHDAEDVLARYQAPLATAAYELQGRIYNIVVLGFLRKYYVDGDEAQRTYAVENTLYVLAQFLGWSEILTREIQFLSFADTDRTRAVARRQQEVVEVLQSDDPALGRPFLIWRGEQRAIGERMIEHDRRRLHCLGYAGFLDRDEAAFGRWLGRLERDIAEVSDTPSLRLRRLQHALVDLIRELDPDRVRYADERLQKI
jgi:hypothetical protein